MHDQPRRQRRLPIESTPVGAVLAHCCTPITPLTHAQRLKSVIASAKLQNPQGCCTRPKTDDRARQSSRNAGENHKIPRDLPSESVGQRRLSLAANPTA